MPPYRPGDPPTRGYTGYTAYQEACWQAMDTVYHAHYFGYGDTRQPTPGGTMDSRRYTSWMKQFDEAWAKEAERDPKTRGLTGTELGESLMRHLYERFLQAAVNHQEG